jgi:two-component system sensor histidine kinase UhpB
MKIKHWHSWGIRPRIVLVSMLPVIFLFFSVIFYSYNSRLTEVREELEDRGRIVSSSLASSSEYGVISGNLSELERMLTNLLDVDKSIYRVQIQDANRRILVEVVNKKLEQEKTKEFEAKIARKVIDIDTFGDGKEQHAATSTVGYVKVVLSPSIMLAKKRDQILIGSLIATIALIASIIVGLYLALSLTKSLSVTIDKLRDIRAGNYDVDMKVSAGGELGELQATIVEMADTLKQSKENLESQVIARTKDLQEARDQALKAHAENRRLIQKVHSAVEEERENIAVEIHDHLNASLIVAKLAAQRIADLTAKIPESAETVQITLRAQSIVGITSDLYQLARGIIKRLRPEIIDTLGLRDAVEEMVRYYDELHPDCKFDFSAEGDFSGLQADLAISAYRLVQEALSNVVKHSQATHAWIELRVRTNQLTLKISDNGKGFAQDATEPGIGLIGMRERVYSWNGKLEISSEVGAGTTVVASLPI